MSKKSSKLFILCTQQTQGLSMSQLRLITRSCQFCLQIFLQGLTMNLNPKETLTIMTFTYVHNSLDQLNRIADSERLPSPIVMQQNSRQHSVPPSGRSCFEVPQAVLRQPSMTTNWIIFPGIRVEINKTCFRYLPHSNLFCSTMFSLEKILHCEKTSQCQSLPRTFTCHFANCAP